LFENFTRRILRSVAFAAAAILASLPAYAGEPVFPPGYSVGLTPPEGMLPAGDFVGFEDRGAGAAITLYDLPAEAFERISADFTPEALVEQGLSNPERAEVAIDGVRSAILITGEQEEQGVALRKWILIATTDQRAALVVGETVGEVGRYDADVMRAALLTLTFRERPPLADRHALLPFRVGDRADFRPVETDLGNALILTDGDGITDPTQPIVIVTAIPGEPPAHEFRDRFALGTLMTLEGMSDFEVERSESFRQRNDDWHEIVAEARGPEGSPLIVMQTLRFSRQGTFHVLATVRLEDRAEMMPRFRRVADSVEPR
jgi:hypothetical protein